MRMSGFNLEANEEQSIDIIHNALEYGVDYFDLVDMYGNRHNEELLEKTLKCRFHQKEIIFD